MMTESLEEKVRNLPPDISMEVGHFIDFLMSKYCPPGKKLQLHWRGALKDENCSISSVELQHQARDWWEE
jgi:CobQ-like glutamine amidotransferase family enzyme